MTDPVLYPVLLVGGGAALSLWFAWRARLPTLILAIPVGLLVGPVLGWIPTTALLDEPGIRAFLLAAAGIWLFALGRRARLTTLPRDVLAQRMLYVVPLLHAVLVAGAAFWLMQWPPALALLTGGLLGALSAYALGPLLRYAPLSRSLTAPLQYENRVGAPLLLGLVVLGVSVVQVVEHPIEPPATTTVEHIALGVGLDVFTALGIAGVGVALLLGGLRWSRRPAPALPVTAALIVWAGLFVADALHHGPGLIVPLLMGVLLAYQPWVQPTGALRLPTTLHHSTTALLGVVIGASLSTSVWDAFTPDMLLWAGAVVALRPLTLLLAWWGTRRAWRDLLVLGLWHPRGLLPLVLAAAIGPFVAHWYPTLDASWLAALAFVTVSTGALTALGSRPMARILGEQPASPGTVLFVGAGAPARAMAAFLEARGIPVHLIDNRPDAVAAAHDEGLAATCAALDAPEAYDPLPLADIESVVLALPDHPRLRNAAAHALGAFPHASISGLLPRDTTSLPASIPPLGAPPISHHAIHAALRNGAQIHAFRPGDLLSGDDRRASYDAEELRTTFTDATATPLFLIRENGALHMIHEALPATIRAADRVVLLVPSPDG
ncbi:MAG: hypothetical protein R6U20_08955 [Longimonas sp.]|uniref:hypothetical protein n=1 Tax=Longimonas sp. TaxID=2039626 RepID=UPI003975EBD2